MTLDIERVQFRDAIVARAVVLLAEGRNLSEIERTLVQDFPDERTPSRDSVREWDRALADTSTTDAPTRIARIIDLADDAVVAGLRDVLTADDPRKSLMSTNAVAGTYRDKQARTAGGAVNITLLVTERAAAIQASIEGEYKELDD